MHVVPPVHSAQRIQSAPTPRSPSLQSVFDWHCWHGWFPVTSQTGLPRRVTWQEFWGLPGQGVFGATHAASSMVQPNAFAGSGAHRFRLFFPFFLHSPEQH